MIASAVVMICALLVNYPDLAKVGISRESMLIHCMKK